VLLLKVSQILEELKNQRKIRRTIIILSSNNHNKKLSLSLLFLLHKLLKINLSNSLPNKFQMLRSNNNLKTTKRWQRRQLIRRKKRLRNNKLN
jgi:hypothetical protein